MMDVFCGGSVCNGLTLDVKMMNISNEILCLCSV
jgi:hypothetical protein